MREVFFVFEWKVEEISIKIKSMNYRKKLQKLAFDRVSSSTKIAMEMLECSIRFFGDPQLHKLIEDIISNQPSMALVLNIASKILGAKDKTELEKLKCEFLKSENNAINEAFEYLRKVKNIITISFSGSVLSVLLKIRPKKVFVSVSHPANEGETLAQRLLDEGINVALFEDAAYSIAMRKADAVLIGADAILENFVVNKIGSYPLALLSKEFNRPFYVVASKFKFLDKKVEGLYRILEMNPKEISRVDCEVINVYFEKVPIKLISKIFMG